MQTSTLRKSSFLLLGTVITVTQIVRVPETVAITLAAGGIIWWLSRRRHARSAQSHARRARQLRRRVVTAGVMTAAVWLLFMVVESGYELTDMLTSPDGGAQVDGFPGRLLLEGLLSTTGVTYLILAIAEQPRRHRRRRHGAKASELATVQQQAPDEA